MTDDSSLDLVVAPHPTHKTVGDGDFLAEVKNGVLYLPQDVYDLGQHAVPGNNSAKRYISRMLALPSAFANSLSWTSEQMSSALDKIITQLEGLLPDRYLHPGPPKQYSFGARLPEQFKDHWTSDDYKKDD